MDTLSVDASMSHTSRMRRFLGSLPAKTIQFENVSEITRQVGGDLDDVQVRGTLKYLEKLGEIKILSDQTPGGRVFWHGIELVKMASSNEVFDKEADKLQRNLSAPKFAPDEKEYPLVSEYMRKKIAITKARDLLAEVGETLNVDFTVNGYAEEAISLIRQMDSLTMQLESMSKQRDQAVIEKQKFETRNTYWQAKISTLPEQQREKWEKEAPWNNK